MIAFLSALLDTSRQHHDSSAIALPHHSPEIVASRMQRSLGHNKLPWRIVTLLCRIKIFSKKIMIFVKLIFIKLKLIFFIIEFINHFELFETLLRRNK